jgi:hypothetical protein
MDLYGFMMDAEPPLTPTEVLGFWRVMLNVACALQGIHILKLRELANLSYTGYVQY